MLFEELNKDGTTTRKKWSDLSTGEKYFVMGAVAGVGYILYLGMSEAFGRGNIENVPVNPDLLVYETEGGQILQWNPDPLSKEIFENLEGWNAFTYPETTDKIRALQDEQIKALYNHYNNYYAKDQKTLTRLINGEAPDWEGSYAKTVARLKSLGLN